MLTRSTLTSAGMRWRSAPVLVVASLAVALAATPAADAKKKLKQYQPSECLSDRMREVGANCGPRSSQVPLPPHRPKAPR